jgi:hypothetical protein
MQIEQLDTIKNDLEETAAHFEALLSMLQGHATYLRSSKYGDKTEEIELVERSYAGVAESLLELRKAADKIPKAA